MHIGNNLPFIMFFKIPSEVPVCYYKVFIIGWSNLLNFPCLHIGILKQSYVKNVGTIFPGRGGKSQLWKIPIEINSWIWQLALLGRYHNRKMKICCQIPNNAPNFIMLCSKCLYLWDLSNVYFRFFTFSISTEIDAQGHPKVMENIFLKYPIHANRHRLPV